MLGEYTIVACNQTTRVRSGVGFQVPQTCVLCDVYSLDKVVTLVHGFFDSELVLKHMLIRLLQFNKSLTLLGQGRIAK